MKSLTKNLTLVFFAAAELVIGIMLLNDPENFTRTLILCFGIMLLLQYRDVLFKKKKAE